MKFYSQYTKCKRAEGFTLIELLVAISIMALLAAIIIASINTARKQSRDNKRIADLKNIELALELYKELKGGYPYCSGQAVLINGIDDAYQDELCIVNELVSQTQLLSKMEFDPTNSGSQQYSYRSTGLVTGSSPEVGKSFLIRVRLEGKPVEVTHSYPGHGHCGTACPWYGQSCVYPESGGDCDTAPRWYHLSR